jgi:Fe-S-cluster containining protein
MTRQGTCNDCGHCCETFARHAVVRSDVQMAHDPEFYRVRGFQAREIDGEPVSVLLAWIAAPCPAHQDGRCAVHDQKPQTCQDFPKHLADIVGTPCSYWFEAGDVKMGGLGSPYPVSADELLRLERQ